MSLLDSFGYVRSECRILESVGYERKIKTLVREVERRHEYDHHLGYAAEHHYDVQPVCTLCHARRDGTKAKQTHCIHGHEFTPENTIIKTSGTRACRECRRAHDRKRGRDASYWREYRKGRKAQNG